jgi:hypothetical protein
MDEADKRRDASLADLVSILWNFTPFNGILTICY